MKQCQTEDVKCTSVKIQTEAIRQNHFQVQVDLECVPVLVVSAAIGVYRKGKGKGVRL